MALTPLQVLAAESARLSETAWHEARKKAYAKVAEICRDPATENAQDAIMLFEEERALASTAKDLPRQSVYAWAALRLQQLWYQAHPLKGATTVR